MDKLAACLERESCDPITGELGILRKEFRVDLISDWGYEALQNAWGSTWQRHSPFATHLLATRYIRRGVEEPWTPFNSANSFEHALEYIDDKATPLCSELYNLQKLRAEAAAEAARLKVEQREAEYAREEQDRLRAASEAAWVRLRDGSPVGSELCSRWNTAVRVCLDRAGHDSEFKARVTELFRSLHDAVIFATKVPAKRKAIKAALAWLEDHAAITGYETRPEEEACES